jgi:hypothetical protein
MKNFFYVITKEDQEPLEVGGRFRTVFNEVLVKYHFPACQAYADELTAEEKQEILTDEFTIVRRKVKELEPDLEIHQVPRILYDMFYFLFFVEVMECDKLGYELDVNLCHFNCSIRTFARYCQKAKEANRNIARTCYSLNIFIVKFMNKKKLNIINTDYVLLLSTIYEALQKAVEELPNKMIETFEQHPEVHINQVRTYYKKDIALNIHRLFGNRYQTLDTEKVFEAFRYTEVDEEIDNSEISHVINCCITMFVKAKAVEAYNKLKQEQNLTGDSLHLTFLGVKTALIEKYVKNVDAEMVKTALRSYMKYINPEFGYFIRNVNMRLIYTVLISEISDAKTIPEVPNAVAAAPPIIINSRSNSGTSNSGTKTKPIVIDSSSSSSGSSTTRRKHTTGTGTRRKKAQTGGLMSNKVEYFNIYRGADEKVGETQQNFESPIDGRKNLITHQKVYDNMGYSLSYNTGIFNGVMSDRTACTYHFMNEKTPAIILTQVINREVNRGNVFKNKYVLKKFFYGDNSFEDQLFFIPPILPLINLFSSGETWHVRSKIFQGSELTNIKNFANCFDEHYYRQMFSMITAQTKEEVFPQYLKSTFDQERMKKAFRSFVKYRRFTILGDVKNGKKIYDKYFTKTRTTFQLAE